MKIDKLTDEQKSVLLAKVMGWDISEIGHFQVKDAKGEDVYPVSFSADKDLKMIWSLYDPANMPLAWRVLNHFHALDLVWEVEKSATFTHHKNMSGNIESILKDGVWDARQEKIVPFVALAPADATRALMDTVLELAIEAGIVEEES